MRQVAAGFTFDRALEGNYRLERARGGGALYDVGCYAIAAALWAFGDVAPVDVAARLRLGPSGVDLGADLVLDFPTGTAEVHAAMDEPDRQWLLVRGDGGEIELPGAPFSARDADTELLVSDGRGTRRQVFAAVNPYRLMVEDVSRVLRGGAGWVLPLAESRAVAAVVDAAFTKGA